MDTTTLKGKYGEAHVMLPRDAIADTALAQIRSFLDHPAFTSHIAVMPDTHAGKGAVIGFTMPMTERVIPNVIGVDIGCGMMSFNIGSDLAIDHDHVDAYVRAKVPFGFEIHEQPLLDMGPSFPWERARRLGRSLAAWWGVTYGHTVEPVRYDMDWFVAKCRQVGIDHKRALNSLGSLGGGNHFIELGRSTADGSTWVTIHSGSRAFGLKIATYWQSIAAKRFKKGSKEELKAEILRIRETATDKRDISRLIAEARASHGINRAIPEGLEWLEGEDAVGYLFDMLFAQVYAEVNRELMADVLAKALDVEVLDTVCSTHNYIDFADRMIRKGAIRSYEGERMVIPFNMRDGVLICEGRSNDHWNCSAPHGAGRVMSRRRAHRELDVEQFREQMRDVYSTSVGAGTLDEAPGAYKPAELIEAAIAPTAQIQHRLVPIHSMKAAGGGPRRKRKTDGSSARASKSKKSRRKRRR